MITLCSEVLTVQNFTIDVKDHHLMFCVLQRLGRNNIICMKLYCTKYQKYSDLHQFILMLMTELMDNHIYVKVLRLYHEKTRNCHAYVSKILWSINSLTEQTQQNFNFIEKIEYSQTYITLA